MPQAVRTVPLLAALFIGLLLGASAHAAPIVPRGIPARAEPSQTESAVENGVSPGPGFAAAHKLGHADTAVAAVYRVQDFGGMCDGVADDTDAFKRFINALQTSVSARTRGLISGHCRLTAAVSLRPKPGTSLEGEGSDPTILCAGTAAGWCMTIYGGGASGAKLRIHGDTAKDARRLAVSDAGTLQAGDYIVIAYQDATDPNKFSQGQLNRVSSKSGNSPALAYPITFPMTFAHYTGTVQKVTTTSGLTIKNLAIDGSLSRAMQHGLNVTNFVDATISNLDVRDFVSRALAQTGFNLMNCDACRVQNTHAQRIRGHAVYFNGLVNSTIANLTVDNLVGVPIEFTWSSRSKMSHVTVALAPSSEARAFKLTGSTENTFRDIKLSGGKIRTGFSLTSGTSYNKIYRLVSKNSSSCVWLNGTANNYNFFDGVVTDNCSFRGTASVAPYAGYSIVVAATAPYRDVGNRFVNVDPGSRQHLHIVDRSNTVSFRVPAGPDVGMKERATGPR